MGACCWQLGRSTLRPSKARQHKLQCKSTELKLRRAGGRHLSHAPFVNIAVNFVPAHGALEGCPHWPRLETQFALRALAIHKHHVPRNLHAFDRDAWFASD